MCWCVCVCVCVCVYSFNKKVGVSPHVTKTIETLGKFHQRQIPLYVHDTDIKEGNNTCIIWEEAELE